MINCVTVCVSDNTAACTELSVCVSQDTAACTKLFVSHRIQQPVSKCPYFRQYSTLQHICRTVFFILVLQDTADFLKFYCGSSNI